MNGEVFTRHGMSPIGGVLHIGVNECEELDFYRAHGASFVVWMEANAANWPLIRAKIDGLPNHYLVECAVGDLEGHATFYLYSDKKYNSFLRPGGGDPLMHLSGETTVRTSRVDDILTRLPAEVRRPTLLTMDIQGAEHKALAGMPQLLAAPELRFIYSEVAWANYYSGQISEADYVSFLKPFGFVLVDRDEEGGKEWGNLLFAKRPACG